LFRLALSLGIWDVDMLAESMSAELLFEWLGFYQLEPFGDEWLRHSIQACQFYNAHRGKSQAIRKPQDFMPVEARPQTPQQMHDILQSIPRAS
jgi:predicted ATPase